MHNAHEVVSTLENLIQGDPNSALPNAWARLLKVEPDRASFALAISAVLSKFDALEDELARADLSDRARSLYTAALGSLRPLVDPLTMAGKRVAELSKHRQQLDILHLAVDALHSVPAPDIPEVEKADLVRKFQELLAEVSESEIEAGLKRLLLAHLTTLLNALLTYETLGVHGLARVYGVIAAELMVLNPVAEKAPEATRSIYAKAYKLAKRVGGVIVWASAVAEGTSALVDNTSEIFGLGYNAVADSDGNQAAGGN